MSGHHEGEEADARVAGVGLKILALGGAGGEFERTAVARLEHLAGRGGGLVDRLQGVGGEVGAEVHAVRRVVDVVLVRLAQRYLELEL